MAALVAEGSDHQVGGAVHDLGMIHKAGRRADESAQPHHACDLVEISERGLELAEQVDGAHPRCLLTVLDRDVTTELAFRNELAISVEAELAGYHHEVAGAYERHVIGDRGDGLWQHH